MATLRIGHIHKAERCARCVPTGAPGLISFADARSRGVTKNILTIRPNKHNFSIILHESLNGGLFVNSI
jgi:hypothetical protein